MSSSAPATEVIIWADGQRAGLLGDLLEVMAAQVKPIGVGGPRVAQVDELATRLDCPREDDLRHLIISRPAAFLLIATTEFVSPDDLRTAAGQNTSVLTLEPLAHSLDELHEVQQTPRGQRDASASPVITLAPAFAASPGYLDAADPREVVGSGRLIIGAWAGPSREATLFARLIDAWMTILPFSGVPETIDASLIAAIDSLPDDLGRLAGHIAAHARTPGGCSVALGVSDAAAVHRRRLHIVGSEGDVLIDDASYELHDPAGTRLEGSEPRQPLGVIDLIANQWRRLIDRVPTPDTPEEAERLRSAMACCHACLLSIRTGQPESPATILQMNR